MQWSDRTGIGTWLSGLPAYALRDSYQLTLSSSITAISNFSESDPHQPYSSHMPTPYPTPPSISMQVHHLSFSVPCSLLSPPTRQPTITLRSPQVDLGSDADIIIIPQIIAAHLTDPINQQLQQTGSTENAIEWIVTHRWIPGVTVFHPPKG